MFRSADVIYRYDNTYEGFLSCVFESFLKKERPENIVPDNTSQLFLTPSRYIETDFSHARRVAKFLPGCLGSWMYNLLLHSYLSCFSQKEIFMLTLIQEVYQGRSFHLGEEPLHSLFSRAQYVKREAHQWKGFLRFSDYQGWLVAAIHPENYVLPLLSKHFSSRYPSESLLIFDAAHHIALTCRHGVCEIFAIKELSLAEPSSQEQQYRLLWKEYFHQIAIESRRNPNAQRSLMPKRYWKDMTEFDFMS